MAKRVLEGPQPVSHFIIPDTQSKPDVPLDHMLWAGRYAAEQKPDVVVHLGDNWDFPSLSSYEKPGSKYFEGKRVLADIDAGNEALRLFEKGLRNWQPKRKILLRGNHEDRLTRMLNENPKFEDIVGFHQFNDVELGWEVHDFLEPVEVDSLTYSHYFATPGTGRPYSGSIDTMLRNIGFSFVAGHQQGLRWGRRELTNGRALTGLVAGSFYQHREAYLTPQGNDHKRCLVILHEVLDGDSDPMVVSLDFLRRKFA